MIDADVIRLRQIDGFLRALLEHEDPKRTAMFERRLLPRPIDASLKDPIGDLTEIAKQFQAFGDRHADRRHKLAQDLAAISRLHTFLRKENEALSTATLSKTRDHVNSWIKAIVEINEAIKSLQQNIGEGGSGGSLASLAALEIIVDAVLDQASGGNRMVRKDIGGAVDDALRDARSWMLLGMPRSALPLGSINKTLEVQAKVLGDELHPAPEGEVDEIEGDDIDEIVSAYSTRQARKFARSAAAAAKAASVMYQDVEADLAMLKASETLKAVFDSVDKECFNVPVVPSADDGLVWSVALLIDGWKPRKLNNDEPCRVMTTSSNKRGDIAILTKNLFKDETRGYGKPAEAAGEALKKRGRAPHVFTGRRLTGLDEGQFFPDRFDRLEEKEAAILEEKGVPVPEGVVVRRQRIGIVHRLQWQQP
jgi:hypothetical protein